LKGALKALAVNVKRAVQHHTKRLRATLDDANRSEMVFA
jgi:hypothetical protein